MMLTPADREALAWIIFLIVCLSLTALFSGCAPTAPADAPCASGVCPLTDPMGIEPINEAQFCDTE